MPDPSPPPYKVYRSRKRLRDRFGGGGQTPLDALRRRGEGEGPREPGAPGRGRGRRILKWVAIAVAGWIALSVVLFFVSAQTTGGVSDKTKEALSGGGTVLTGSNILVLGSDQRPKNSKEPGAHSGNPRSDSIMLLHVGFGTVRKLSILRDSRADIPGHGGQRINAAFALGGPALTIKTVESFLGNDLHINHVILVSFTDFPDLIDALGGVDVKLDNCVKSNSFGGKKLKLKKGEHHLTGRQALAFARVRENKCNPKEDDRARAARQQQVLSSMRSKVASPIHWPSDFVRGPWIAWEAPRAFRSDMHGPGLAALFTDLLTGGGGKTEVLDFDSVNGDGTLNVSSEAKADAVKKLTGG